MRRNTECDLKKKKKHETKSCVFDTKSVFLLSRACSTVADATLVQRKEEPCRRSQEEEKEEEVHASHI